MRKFITVTAVVLLLVACSGEKAAQENKQVKDKEVKQESSTDDQVQEDEKEKDLVSEDNRENVNAAALPEYTMNEGTFALEPIGEANPKVILLTIDDAPDEHALEMAKTLKKLDAPAIFFVNGHFITTEKEEIIKEIHNLGFVIGNHTFSHSDLTTLPEEKQKEEILSVNEIVEKVTGEKPKFFRAPFGSNTEFSKQLVKEEQMLLMNWTYGYDWESEYMSGDAIANIMVTTPLLQNGANLLMHDREWTNEGLERIVKGLRDKGYEILDPNLIDTEIK